jgi:hypothetical protein
MNGRLLVLFAGDGDGAAEIGVERLERDRRDRDAADDDAERQRQAVLGWRIDLE